MEINQHHCINQSTMVLQSDHNLNFFVVCGFSGAVLSLAMGEEGESCYSGGLDGTVRGWKIPDLNVDPYDNYGKST